MSCIGAGVTMAVVTYKPLRYAESILEMTGLRRYFGVGVGGTITADGSSKADLIQEALDRRGVRRARPVYIGDYDGNRRAANASKIHFLRYGPADWKALAERILSADHGVR